MFTVWPALGALTLFSAAAVAIPARDVDGNPIKKRDVDLTYPYLGPEIPIGDPANPTLDASKGGFRRLWEPPAVHPLPGQPVTNNINVISSAIFPGGINIHFQTPFGIGGDPQVQYGSSAGSLDQVATGTTHTYDRTPPCSLMDPTQCSQFFHEVPLTGLTPGQTYYYRIPGGNGTTPSDVLSFKVALAAGDNTPFSISVVADMGYTNARGTYDGLVRSVQEGAAFVWHGGDISYADQWFGGMYPCKLPPGAGSWEICYNGSNSRQDSGPVTNPEYLVPLPEGEYPNWGGPLGGDMSTVYETNWDLWQQWMNPITKYTPYMVVPGNHDVACAEFDGPNGELTALLEKNQAPGTKSSNKKLNYYSCPPSQRNFTAYQHRFHMPGNLQGRGVGNFWYSFDYGLVHFISLNGETDYYKSPENSFQTVLANKNSTLEKPLREWTNLINAGPFGYILNGDYKNNSAYEQYQWLKADLASVDRTKTPWVIVMAHRPMYSSTSAPDQAAMRNAYEDLLLKNQVDLFVGAHVHWYERIMPVSKNTVNKHAKVGNNTYLAEKPSMIHITNGQGGNVEPHTRLKDGQAPAFWSAVLDQVTYGFSKLTVFNETVMLWEYVRGSDGNLGDYLWIKKA